MTSRRHFLRLSASAAAVAATGLSWAQAETDKRFVVVLLRGGMDGLSMLPPHGDPHYADARRGLAIAAPGTDPEAAIPVNDLLGIHPAMPTVGELWRAGEATLLHAVGWEGTKRSHFEAQDLLEGGGPQPRSQRTGWLGRALQSIGSPAAAIGSGMPLLLRGGEGATVIDPGMRLEEREDLMVRLSMMYDGDEELTHALSQSQQTSALLEELPEGSASARRGRSRQRLRSVGAAAATVLAEPQGARIAVLDTGGWDTHAGQRNSLRSRLDGLDQSLAGLREGLGALWGQTAVVVVTEFGRTVEQNGTGGTDHGTGSAALLLGGAVRGSVIADWPGLAPADRFDGRDLRPTTDLRALFKGLLIEHLGLTAGAAGAVFPGSEHVLPLRGLV